MKRTFFTADRSAYAELDSEDTRTVLDNTNEPTAFKVYKVRWYVLILYSVLLFLTGITATLWGTMPNSAEFAFGWNEDIITLLTNWNPIMNVITTFPFCWLIGKKGLRFSCIVSCVLFTAGTGISCISSEPPYVKWFVNIGLVLSSSASPFLYVAPTLVSATWFPPRQRVTATAITQLFNAVGNVVPSLLIPIALTDLSGLDLSCNGSCVNRSHDAPVNVTGSHQPSRDRERLMFDARQEIMAILYSLFAVVLLCSALVVFYFPAKPPTPPCIIADDSRLDFGPGLKRLLCLKNFWVICLSSGITQGLTTGWLLLFVVNFGHKGFSQVELNNVTAVSFVLSLVITFIISLFLGKLNSHLKTATVVSYAFGFVSSLWLTIIYLQINPASIIVNLGIPLTVLYISLIMSTTLVYELASEVSYPTGEVVVIGLIAWISNPFQALIGVLKVIPGFEDEWLGLTVVLGFLLGAFILGLCKFRYNRRAAENIIFS